MEMTERTEIEEANVEPGTTKNGQEQVDFETAISLTGYGKFNILLNLVAIPAVWSSVFDTSTASYILTAAECDLNLSINNKGILNAMAYGGMIFSALIWGFLSDTLGRRKLLLVGFCLLTALMIASSFSQAFWLLTVFKFLEGFIACGPFAVLLAYLAEFNSSHHRARAIMIVGIYTSMGIVAVPALAWALIPQPWSWTLFGGYITYNSWHVFILVTSLPNLLAGCGMWFFDESPKFLMSCGRREEALAVFRRVYSINTGNPPETFPVKSLLEEKSVNTGVLTSDTSSNSVMTLLKLGYKQMKPFFLKPYANRAALVFIIQFGGLGGMNTIRLWLPQLFTIIEDYFVIHEPVSGNATLCNMLASWTEPANIINEAKVLNNEPCVPMQIGDTMYIYTIIVGVATAAFNLFASLVINCVGKKNILVIGYALGGCCVVSMYWCNSMEVLLVLASLFVGSGTMCTNALISVVVDLFPTSLRTLAVSMTMMVARVGSLTGNITFPIFLEISCSMPFFLIGSITLVCSILTFLLPRTTGKALE